MPSKGSTACSRCALRAVAHLQVRAPAHLVFGHHLEGVIRVVQPELAARVAPEADDHRLPMVVPAHVHLCIVVPVQLDGELVIRKSYCMNDESSLASCCRLARCLLHARSFTK